MFLSKYVRAGNTRFWAAKSMETAVEWDKKSPTAEALRRWCRDFLADRHNLPTTPENTWTKSLLEKHPDFKVELTEHLQSIGKYVRALDIVHFMADP
ncbi:hypothetical protein LXA43DRAFT_857762, partial [Ganoderma leucocontextum]